MSRSKNATKSERFLAEMEAELYWQTFLELLTPNALTTATEGGYLRIHWPPF